MTSRRTTEGRETYNLPKVGGSVAYITLVIGYLLTILTTTHLTLLNFLVFTVLQVCYCAVLLGLLWGVGKMQEGWALPVTLGLLVVITGATGVLPIIGLQWDWLLYLVTLSMLVVFLPLRLGIGAGILLYLGAMLNLGWLDDWRWSQVYPLLLTFLPAFLFVGVFSVVLSVLEEQKERAELLLRQLEVSKAELERAHAQLQEYANEVEELTIVRERTRLAREIHDTLGHYLSILNIQLETIGKLQERDPERVAVEIAEARRVAAQSMQEVRNAVAALRPTSIAELSFVEAIRQLGKEFERNSPETSLTLDLETELPALSPDVSVALYRAVQETLTNVRKHAEASKVLVRLRYEEGMVDLLVLDNGKGGMDSGQEGRGEGFGLIGLRERIELLDGQVSYGPSEQGGYRVVVRIPVSAGTSLSSGVNSASGEAEKEVRIVF